VIRGCLKQWQKPSTSQVSDNVNGAFGIWFFCECNDNLVSYKGISEMQPALARVDMCSARQFGQFRKWRQIGHESLLQIQCGDAVKMGEWSQTRYRCTGEV